MLEIGMGLITFNKSVTLVPGSFRRADCQQKVLRRKNAETGKQKKVEQQGSNCFSRKVGS